MEFLKRMLGTTPLRSQRQVGERTAQVVERVIFDLGVDNLVQGSFGLDRDCRPHFSSAVIRPARGGIAIALDGLPECAALADAVRGDCDAALLRARTAAVVAGLVREFQARSPAFRALPVAPSAASPVPVSAADGADASAVWSFD